MLGALPDPGKAGGFGALPTPAPGCSRSAFGEPEEVRSGRYVPVSFGKTEASEVRSWPDTVEFFKTAPELKKSSITHTPEAPLLLPP